MSALWCNGTLCPTLLRRFHATCLTCRGRREFYGKWDISKTRLAAKVLPWTKHNKYPDVHYIVVDLKGHRLATWARLIFIELLLKTADKTVFTIRKRLCTVAEITGNLTV